ncbi:MAG: c-type cytochrome [bacterium]|nr:c-type cytochrome [bacterium]
MKYDYLIIAVIYISIASCNNFSKKNNETANNLQKTNALNFAIPDTQNIPKDAFGQAVRYGQQLLVNTVYYIGPNGIKGQYTANKMNCSNCHQDAGTKPFSFNLMRAHQNYPQYRSRENKILTLADRVNNCVMRPHNGQPLPYEGEEMTAILSYLKWINSFVIKKDSFLGSGNQEIQYPPIAASPIEGGKLYKIHCQRCHQANGDGVFGSDSNSYIYPPLWGPKAYQAGSSMHRVTKLASWLKSNMPHKEAQWNKPILTDVEALHLAAFVNEDTMHPRPFKAIPIDYPNPDTKPMDYDHGPYADTFTEAQHKYGPFPPIIDYWKKKGQNLNR